MSPQLAQQVGELLEQGLGVREIARRIGRSPGRTHDIIQRVKLGQLDRSGKSGTRNAGSAAQHEPSSDRQTSDCQDEQPPVELVSQEQMVELLERMAYRFLRRIERSSEDVSFRDAVGAMKVSAELACTLRRALDVSKASKASAEHAGEEWSRLRPATWSPEQRSRYRETGELPDGPPAAARAVQ